MILRALGQSGYRIRTAGCDLLLDPYLSDSVNRVAGRPRLLPIPIDPATFSCDAVICTHDHLDHLDPDTVTRLPREQLFITTLGGKEKLRSLGRENVIALKEGESVSVGDVSLTAVFAAHTVEAFGLILRAEGKTLYFSGDTLYDERLLAIGGYHPDVAFLCINGRLGNMNAEEACRTAERIGARYSIPNHYDMFASNAEDPHRFADRVKGGLILEFDRPYRLTDRFEALSEEEM